MNLAQHWRGLVAMCCLAAPVLAAAVPDYAAVRAAHRPSDIELLDRRGEPVQMLRVDAQVRRAAWLPLAELSPAMREAIVLSEDKRFWLHSGVDWRALAGSAWANAWNGRTRGASTVTMQLAGLLDAELERPAQGRSVGQKLQQIGSAQRLEARWSKAQILEAYLNLVPMRGELVGVPAAAQQLFGKHPSGLDRSESALLAALVRAPNASQAALVRRGCELLQAMHERPQAGDYAVRPPDPSGATSWPLGYEQSRGATFAHEPCAGLATLTAQALARRPGPARGEAIAPHFARAWVGAGGAAKTALDAPLQRLALAALRQHLMELRGRNVEDGAVLVLHNRSGEVRAWVGSAAAGDTDAVLARRQPGSTLKPFVYAEAFRRRLITPQSLLQDEPLQLASGRDAYQPQNFDHAWRGYVPAREALAASLNVPAVRVGAMLGPDALFEALQRAGLHLRESAGFHGHALALGSAEVTLLDLTNAYRLFANRGQASPIAWPGAVREPRRSVFEPALARTIAGILADPSARAASFGFDSPLVTRRGAAVKTGTSKDMRDNWCIGFNDEYTVGVWVGNRGGAPMHGVSGVTGAAPLWARVMAALPGGLSVEGTTPARATPVPAVRETAHRIGPIRDGSVLAMDPDIPLARQRLRLTGPSGQWVVNGRIQGRGEQLWWPLTPGRHMVELRDANGRALDRLAFEVRPGIGPGPGARGPAIKPVRN